MGEEINLGRREIIDMQKEYVWKALHFQVVCAVGICQQ